LKVNREATRRRDLRKVAKRK